MLVLLRVRIAKATDTVERDSRRGITEDLAAIARPVLADVG
jgi:hypothetical protein